MENKNIKLLKFTPSRLALYAVLWSALLVSLSYNIFLSYKVNKPTKMAICSGKPDKIWECIGEVTEHKKQFEITPIGRSVTGVTVVVTIP